MTSEISFGPARYWAIDLHVHTPASKDVHATQYGATAPRDVVDAALRAGLDAIAITDHNTAAWCDSVGNAAEGTNLIVLPGVEISTSEGHLLAVFEQGTPGRRIEDLLVSVGIATDRHGDLDTLASGGFEATAHVIASCGGLAIAAHIDMPKGLLKLSVPMAVRRILVCPDIAGYEVVDQTVCEETQRKVEQTRLLTFTRGSDSNLAGVSGHRADGVGSRRTWVKASSPDLCGIRHAFHDPALRVRLAEPTAPQHPHLKSLAVTGGFLDTQRIEMCPDLNCFVGGTGTGKSLALELIRFALGQQTDPNEFGAVRTEVDSRLEHVLGTDGVVTLKLAVNGTERKVTRAFDANAQLPPQVDGSADDVSTLMPIKAFSQSEVIEYARAPFGRMQLIDSSLDLDEIEATEGSLRAELTSNTDALESLFDQIHEAKERLTSLDALRVRRNDLAKLFEDEVVQSQEHWSHERAAVSALERFVADLSIEISVPGRPEEVQHSVQGNSDLFEQIRGAFKSFDESAAGAKQVLQTAETQLVDTVTAVLKVWDTRSASFEEELRTRIAKAGDLGEDLDVLRVGLKKAQEQIADLEALQRTLESELDPKLRDVFTKREEIIDKLVNIRHRRRDERSARASHLNDLMAGDVRLRILRERDDREWSTTIRELARGSYLHQSFLDSLAENASPIKLVRSYLRGDAEGVAEALGVSVTHVQKFFDHVNQSGRRRDLLNAQGVLVEDALAVEFRKPGGTEYEAIERLAHGQKCTAILIVALADGTEPLIVDQPEDALHAPWIEEHLVNRLRQLRGTRQFIFATRSPGLVVSADAEMISTLTSSADRGSVEASGSLERHDLNKLALYHLEGGPTPFARRVTKLGPSLSVGPAHG